MDELLYLIALGVGIIGTLTIWKYGRNRQWDIVRTIRRYRREGKK